MKIEQLVKIEFTFILFIVGGLLFIAGKAIVSSPTGMATYDEGKEYSKVQTGMSFNEIREIFGRPDEIEVIEERGIWVEYWYYKGDHTLRIGFIDGKVDSKVVI